MPALESTLEKIGRVLSNKYGINVVCGGERCCTNGRTIYLPSLPDDLPEDLSRAIHAFLDHEAGHVAADSDFKIGAAFKRQHGDAAFGILNCLEDLRIERHMVDTFPGTAANFAHGYRYAYSVSEQAIAKGETLPVMKQVAIAICTRGMGTPDWPMVPPEVYTCVAPLTPLLRQARTAKSTKALVPLAEKVWEQVRPLFGEQASSPGTPAGSPDTDSPDGTSGESASPDAASRRQTRPDASSGGASGRDTTTQPKPGPDATSGRREHRPASGNPSPASGAGNPGPDDADAVNTGGVLGGLGEALVRQISEHAQSTGAYRVWSTSADQVRIAETPNHNSTHQTRMQPVLAHVGGVRQRLLQTLQADVRARWLPDTETGNLNPRALHRLAMTRYLRSVGAVEGLARRVFRQRVVTKRLRTAVTLLVDTSQSMRGAKIALARETALVFCEALARLRIPTSVVGFSTGESRRTKQYAREAGCSMQDISDRFRVEPLLLEVFKRFDEKFERVSGRFDNMHPQRLTPLGESMLYAAKALAARPEDRKVLLVLTDGRPAVGMGDESVTFKHAQDSLRSIEKAGVDVALVGIQDETVRSLQPHSIVVYKLDDLPRTVLAQLQHLLTQPRRAS